MRRYMVLLAGLTGMTFVVWAILALAHSGGVPAPVYSLAAIDRQLGPDLPRWLRQPVRVRAIAIWSSADMAGCSAGGRQCMVMPPLLVDASDGASVALPLIQERAPGLPPLLSDLPFLGQWLPRTATPHWGRVAVYRVQVVQIPFDPMLCLRGPCYAARLANTWD